MIGQIIIVVIVIVVVDVVVVVVVVVVVAYLKGMPLRRYRISSMTNTLPQFLTSKRSNKLYGRRRRECSKKGEGERREGEGVFKQTVW